MPFLTQGKTNWKFLLIVVVLAIIVGGGVIYYQYTLVECNSPTDCENRYHIMCVGKWECINNKCIWDCQAEEKEEITSFEECVAAGYPILESYPRQCKTPDGKTFVEKMEFLDVDEEITADWKTYFNENYNYQMKLPRDWGEINSMDGSFIPDINPNRDYLVFLGSKDGSEQVFINHFRYSRARKHSLEYSVDWYISFYEIDKKEYQRSLIRTRYEDITEIYIPQVNERKGSANRYTYLIEKEKNDCLLEISFLNKNSTTEQIVANLRFLGN